MYFDEWGWNWESKGDVWVKLEIYEDERYKVERPSIGAYSLQYFVDRILN